MHTDKQAEGSARQAGRQVDDQLAIGGPHACGPVQGRQHTCGHAGVCRNALDRVRMSGIHWPPTALPPFPRVHPPVLPSVNVMHPLTRPPQHEVNAAVPAGSSIVSGRQVAPDLWLEYCAAVSLAADVR